LGNLFTSYHLSVIISGIVMENIEIIDHEISEVQVQSSDCGMVSVIEWWNGEGYTITFIGKNDNHLQTILLEKEQISLMEMTLAKIRNM